jgi:hypothetical protein
LLANVEEICTHELQNTKYRDRRLEWVPAAQKCMLEKQRR